MAQKLNINKFWIYIIFFFIIKAIDTIANTILLQKYTDLILQSLIYCTINNTNL